ncbi:MAG: hypothetical protein L6Q54_03235 [Leptospiraceae bacterium]|nr:hypothetical protein [Leptospiraceae bacterium]MCK6380250.1 hypothetical protein [Leptospiraceae bacterium]NUM40907.1 hypothetical protein [Leptospiraceae bacterium]
MKRLILFFLLLTTVGYAQDRPKSESSSLDGFGESEWGASYESIRDKFLNLSKNPNSTEKIEVVNEVKDESLLIRRNGINYLYRFYKTPAIVKESREKNIVDTSSTELDPKTGDQKHDGTGSLYSVGVLFNYVESDLLKLKIENKYGKPKKESLDDNKIGGAVIWELTNANEATPKGGYIVQWKDVYRKKPFSRRMDYYSASIKDMIAKEYKEYFSVPEIKTLKELLN